MDAALKYEIEQLVVVLATTAGLTPERSTTAPLDQLFATLQQAGNDSASAEAEDLIWALWCSHEDETARSGLNHAIGAITRGDLDQAEALLDELVSSWPEWAEAWNKRATLYFLSDRLVESVHDIEKTLALEPRHFGALSGFGQICLSAGDEHSALVAFECALRANPTLNDIRETAERLREKLRPAMH